MAQLVRDERIVLWDRRRAVVYDDAGVRAKWGVAPPSIPDWLAVVGDASIATGVAFEALNHAGVLDQDAPQGPDLARAARFSVASVSDAEGVADLRGKWSVAVEA